MSFIFSFTRILFIVLALPVLITGCKPKQMAITPTPPPRINLSAPVIIYKTHHDYSKNIPVTLSVDKITVVAYPSPADIYFNGQLAYPTKLVDSFWLDNRGIGPNAAFLKLTYEDYAKLAQNPTLDELYNNIADNDPFTEMYQLGYRADYKDIEQELNTIIKAGNFSRFKRLK